MYNIILGIGKCLKVVNRKQLIEDADVAFAALRCSKEEAKLISVDSCPQVEILINDIKSHGLNIGSLFLWTGIYIPGEGYSKYFKNNWFNRDAIYR